MRWASGKREQKGGPLPRPSWVGIRPAKPLDRRLPGPLESADAREILVSRHRSGNASGRAAAGRCRYGPERQHSSESDVAPGDGLEDLHSFERPGAQVADT
jgi:hypothetical protein